MKAIITVLMALGMPEDSIDYELDIFIDFKGRHPDTISDVSLIWNMYNL